MEKVQDAGNGIEIYENDIDLYLNEFCIERNIDDLKLESQSVWNGCLMYIARHLFKDKSKLKKRGTIPNDNTVIPTNCNSYDYELVDSICDYYIYLCSIYDKEVSIMGFSNLVNIDYSVIMEWGNNYTNSNRLLGSLSSDIYKKLQVKREESLSNKLATGNKNPVGILAILNRHYQWNLPGVSREKANQGTLTASELPRLEAVEMSVTDGKAHYLTASEDGKTE